MRLDVRIGAAKARSVRVRRESAPTGALFRSPTYGRKKFGLDRAADPRRGRKRIGDAAVSNRHGWFAGADRQAWRSEATHLLYAVRVRAPGGHWFLPRGKVRRHV